MPELRETNDTGPVLELEIAGRRVTVGPFGAGAVYGPTPLVHRAYDLSPASTRTLGDERHPLPATVEVDSDGQGATVRLAVTNTRTEPLRLWALHPLEARGPFVTLDGEEADPAEWAMFRNGYQSWSGTGTLRVGDVDRDPPLHILRVSSCSPVHTARGTPGIVRSELLTAIEIRPGVALGFGFVTSARQLNGIEVDVRGGVQRSLVATCDMDGIELPPGETIQTEVLRVVAGASGEAVLATLADELGTRMHARVPSRPPAGWCSWYHYYTKVTQAAVEENLESCASLRDRVPLDYVMIDDGHQAHIGDWLDTNAKFPDGMAALAGKISAAGFDAGIWLAPFLADPVSATAREHPEWLLRHDGRPVVPLWNPAWSKTRPMWALDTTHPDVAEWLEEVARTIRYDWGYRVLKLDFLYAVTLPADRHDATATRADALRRGLDAIRAGAGEDAFLLGCGCPLGPAVGVVDGMRIGQDVTPWWSLPVTRTVMQDRHGLATKHAIRNTLARAFMHGRLWSNDPDCLFVKERRNRLTLDEVRALASVIGLSDGMFVLSDRLRDLGAEREEIVLTAARLGGGLGSVPDLFRRDMPETLVGSPGGADTVMVANFEDSPRTREVDLSTVCPALGDAASLVDVWSGQHHSVARGVVVVDLPRHGCVVLRRA
ncbi:MAG: alpha-galactosidase [Acidimicrobiia bacterium]|nr:alpha-galactosidase [Acidimicrobiia bacterium]